jgi:predicted HTH domain antitoxin
MNIQIEVSDSILQKYSLTDSSQVENVIRIGLQQIQIEEALAMYRRGLISLWKAATMAGMPLREMMAQASARGYEPEVDDEMLVEELR